MPDRRRHRGPHPEDHQLFGASQLPRLREATADLSWLLTRGYPPTSALKLVGDRHRLDARQRMAVIRCACGDPQAKERRQTQMRASDLAGEELWIDGYNVLTSIEAAYSGGVLLLARDGCLRDMASMHGSYRKVDETAPALEAIGQVLEQWRVSAHWLLDQPVSNSGRLKVLIEETAKMHRWNWQSELTPDPDPVLAKSDKIVASADSQIVAAAQRWFNLAREIVETKIPDAWVVDLG